jgi:hypothetical protein
MSTTYLNDFRDDIQPLLEDLGYTVFMRETYEEGRVSTLRDELLNENITTVSDAYIAEGESIPSDQFTKRVGWDSFQQDLFITTIYEYNLAELKTNADARMQEIALKLNANRQLGGKVDDMRIVGAQKGYTLDSIDPDTTVIGGLIIKVRIFYKTKKC